MSAEGIAVAIRGAVGRLMFLHVREFNACNP
jgi:hypothetical protein